METAQKEGRRREPSMATVKLCRRLILGHGWHPRIFEPGQLFTMPTDEAQLWCLKGWVVPVATPPAGVSLARPV